MPQAGIKLQARLLPDIIPEPTRGRTPPQVSPEPTLAPLSPPSELPSKSTSKEWQSTLREDRSSAVLLWASYFPSLSPAETLKRLPRFLREFKDAFCRKPWAWPLTHKHSTKGCD